MDLYAENILDHSKSPHLKGVLADPTVTHTERNLSCGDALTLSLRVEHGAILQIAWEGTGCAISQAGMSMLAEELGGMPTQDAANLKPDYLLKLLGVPIGPRRTKCALLSLHTLKNAIRAAEGKPEQLWRETVHPEE